MRTATVTSLFLIALAACGEVATNGTEKTDLPTIAAVEPPTGGAPGGATITLTGTNFDQGETQVVVGARLASAVSVTSATELTFTLPPGVEGETVDVTVFNDGGFGTIADAFTYNLRPALLSITPPLGKGAGGTMVTITGRGFTSGGTPTITLGGAEATSVTVVDDRTITAVTGAAPADVAPFRPTDVTIVNDNGETVLPGAFQISTQGLIVISRFGGRVYHVDVNRTNAVSLLTTLERINSRVRGCALSPTNGKLYALAPSPADFNLSQLYTFDPLTGATTLVGPTADANNGPNRMITSPVFVGANLYALHRSNRQGSPNRLIQVDPGSGTTTALNATALGFGRPANIALKDANTLYFADNLTSSLDTLTLASPTLTAGLPLSGYQPGSDAILGFAFINGTLYAADRAAVTLYSVNPTTAAMTRILDLGPTVGDWVHSICQTPPSF